MNQEDLNTFESGLIILFNTQNIEQVNSILIFMTIINIIKLIW